MPRLRPARWLLPLVLLLASPALLACMWDYDTLRDERRGLPGIAEVLAGKWERHSPYFYEQRVAAMTQALAADPNELAAYDNLAVAHEKLGDPDAAIEVILRKEKVKPGEYTTYANLGTFYLHKGNFENGIKYIARALAINPEAHFGREEYQLMLAKYLRDARASGKPPLEDFLGLTFLTVGQDGKVAAHGTFLGNAQQFAEKGLKANVFDGIVGMIRFGTGKSPDLFYALGNLLTLRGDKHLAFRAYDRAIEYGHPHAASIELLKEELKQYVENHAELSPAAIARERAETAAWVEAYQQHEHALLRAGKNVNDEAHYAPFYKRHGSARASPGFAVADLLPKDRGARAVLVAVALTVLLLAMMSLIRALFSAKRRRRPAAAIA